MDNAAYRIRVKYPSLFQSIEMVVRAFTGLRYGRRAVEAQRRGHLVGTVDGQSAEIRPLRPEDWPKLEAFLSAMPEQHLRFFRPHRFDGKSLMNVLRSRVVLVYGLFNDNEFIAYGILKISPAGSAFMGQLVAPQWTGRGLGRFLVGYLHWQASLAGLRPRATISRENPESLKAHAAVSAYEVCAELPNNYVMIEFAQPSSDPPRLNISRC